MLNERRAARYHRARVRAGLGGFAAAVLVLATCGPWAAGPSLARAGVAVTRGWPGASWMATAAFAAVVLAAACAASYPFVRHRDWTLEGRYGLVRVAASRWRRAHLRSAATGIAIGTAAALVVRAAWLWCGDWWWLAVSTLFLALHLAWTIAAPLLLVAFGGLRPLRRSALAARLDALTRRAGASVAIREWRGGDDTTRAHAALAGLGRTRQIILSDTLLDTLSDDEIEVVVAHELAHHVHGDVWRAAAWRAVSAPITLGVAAFAAWRLGGPAGAWPLGEAPAAATVPLAATLPWLAAVGAAALAVHRLLEPIGFALSRRRELAADAYAVRLTGGADAFVTSMRRLSQTNLIDDRPPALARVLSSHPPVRERVLAALRQAEEASRS